MTISPTQGTISVDLGALDSGDAASLTPDELFAYCEGQMNAIDSQAQDFFQQAQTNNQVESQISDAMSKVKTLQTEMTSKSTNGVNDPDTYHAIDSELHDVQTTLASSGDTEDAATVQQAISVLETGNDTAVSSDEAQKVIDILSSVNSNLGSDNQMSMIHLQSAMSEREQVIQLTTNMLQTLNDSATKVITNIHS